MTFRISSPDVIVGNSDGSQTQLLLTCQLPDGRPNLDERLKTRAVQDVLAVTIHGWLMTRLREEGGMTYGIERLERNPHSFWVTNSRLR